MHTLLIVEDEKLIRQGIRTMVQRSGVPVDVILECNNGESALEILRDHKVDVMFTDIRMPKMSGIELIKAMQELPNPPLTVAISGYDDFTYAVELMRMGVKEYILKPVDRKQICQVMEKLEKELNIYNHSHETSRIYTCQQLKQLLQTEEFSQDVWKGSIARCELSVNDYSMIFSNEFLVCCLDDQGGEAFMEEEIIYISNVEDTEVYIVTTATMNRLLMQEWRNRYVGISSPKNGIEQMKDGYLEAQQARIQAFWTEKPFVQYEREGKCNLLNEKKEVIKSKEVVDIKEVKEIYDNLNLHHYVQMLGTAKAQWAMKQIRNFFWNVRRTPLRINVEEEIQNFLSELLSTYTCVLRTEKEEIDAYCRPYLYPCVSEYERDFLEWLDNFVIRLHEQYEDYKNKQKIQQAIIYIKENYDKDLNMAVVSNYISMNYSLFSYEFKQYTGVNFVNYVKDIRMEKAKELLEQSDLRIMEISQKIGYENEKHFMKTFKSTFGVSPSEFRKNAQYRT